MTRAALAVTVVFLATPAVSAADPRVGQWHLDSADPSCSNPCTPQLDR